MALKEKEKRTLLLGGMGFVLILCVWALFLREGSPWNRWLGMGEQIQQQQDMLDKMRRLRKKFIRLQARTDKVIGRMAAADERDPLSKGLVERLVTSQAPDAQLKKMREDKKSVHGVYLETEVKVELTGMRLDQLIDLLYALEYEAGAQVVRELVVDLNRKNNDLLDAEITIVAAAPVKSEKKPID